LIAAAARAWWRLLARGLAGHGLSAFDYAFVFGRALLA
jgi:hypothetical protein